MVCRLTAYGLLVWCIIATVNAECTSSDCSQEKSTVLNCPPGTTQYNNYCFPNDICPPNTVYKNGVCEIIQQEQNLQCPAPFIFKDGICQNEALIQQTSRCTSNTCSSGNIICPIDSKLVGNTCVRSTPCSSEAININVPCSTCPYDQTPLKTVCEPPVLIIPQTPMVPQPPVVINPEPIIIHITEPPVIVYVPIAQSTPIIKQTEVSVQQEPPSNHVNIIDITNIVENTNIHNVPTNINAVNINNITLSSLAGSQNINNEEISQPNEEESDGYLDNELETYDEPCCVIMEPRVCVPAGDKIKCFHRRHHKCGVECNESESDPGVLISYQTYPEKVDTPVEETTPDPLENEVTTAVPETYPRHYPQPQSYPDLTNLYYGQTNQYSLIYPGQYNPYLMHNQGQSSPIPYQFPGGQNSGILYPGQQFSLSYPYPGGQNTGDSTPQLGQPYAIPEQSNGVNNMEVPIPYPGQSNPVPYPYQDHSFGAFIPYPGQVEQNAYPSQYPGGLSSAFSPSNCVQQQTWPFVNCAQNVKIDCNQCQQSRCHPVCY